jgi:hypothetical protein
MKTNYYARRSANRAPANGAPSRTLRAATCGGETARSGSTPIGDRAPVYKRLPAHQKSVTPTHPCVTYVLNLKCYLCIDCAFQQTLAFSLQPLAFLLLTPC